MLTRRPLLQLTLAQRVQLVGSPKLGALQIHWSQPILDEMSRNLIAKFGFNESDAAELELRLTEYLPRALVDIRKRDGLLADGLEMDANDRHVLAAALSAKATVLLTENIKHFPKEWMAEHGIELLTAGALLERLAVEHPHELRDAHRLTVANSPKSEDEILTTLGKLVGVESARAVRLAVGIG